MYHPRRRGASNLGVYLLAGQVFNMGVDKIPPITLALVLSQTAIYLGFLPQYFGRAESVCMSTYLVWHRHDWRRLLMSQVFHADDMHLYFNMASLLIKGRSLERRFGSFYFAFMVLVFSALTSVGYVAINLVLEERLHDHSYATQCAVGFSGVLFALKVVTTHYAPPGLHYALGFIPMPSRLIYWAELLMIQIIAPNASFVGHLAGILVGLLYIKGPLRSLMRNLIHPASESSYYEGSGQSSGYRSRGWFSFSRRAAAPGSRQQQRQQQRPRPSSSSAGQSYNQNHHHYTGGLSEEEQYHRAMEESRRQNFAASAPQPDPQPQPQSQPSAPPGPGLYPDLDELRQRRAARYTSEKKPRKT